MKHYIPQQVFEDMMADQAGQNLQNQQANRAWALQVYKMTRDGGKLVDPSGKRPVLTKVAAQKGWTFDA